MSLSLITLNFLFIVTKSYAEDYPYPNKRYVQLVQNHSESALKGVFRVTNPSNNAWLIHSWIEDLNMDKEFSVHPSLTRIEPKSSVDLKIIQKKDNIDQKRMIVTMIPSMSSNNYESLVIPVSYRLRIKTEHKIN
ncbi:hypothetical protein A8F92_02380 [Escherichia coli]|nr:hypothetical protein A8F92_02380 [Escherichia coli]